MTHERWNQLMADDDEPFTEEEKAAGWFFCPDCDGLLVQECCYDRIAREGVSDEFKWKCQNTIFLPLGLK